MAERGLGPSLSHWQQGQPNSPFCSDRNVLSSGPYDLVPSSHVWLWGPLGHGQSYRRVKFYMFVSSEFKREQEGWLAIGQQGSGPQTQQPLARAGPRQLCFGLRPRAPSRGAVRESSPGPHRPHRRWQQCQSSRMCLIVPLEPQGCQALWGGRSCWILGATPRWSSGVGKRGWYRPLLSGAGCLGARAASVSGNTCFLPDRSSELGDPQPGVSLVTCWRCWPGQG